MDIKSTSLRRPISRRHFLQASAGSASLLTLVGLAAACAPAASPAGESSTTSAPAVEAEAPAMGGGTMRIATESDVVKLDPGIQQTGSDWPPTALIFSRLVEYDNTMMQPTPGLAESWEQTEDGLTYTFTLRQGVKYHSGRELTAEDVAFTFDRGFEIGPAGRFAGYMISVDSYEATGPYEFVVHLKQLDVAFFNNLAVGSASIVDKETIEQIETHPIGTGP
jgi:ABC-type transport system substrate-binding protein